MTMTVKRIPCPKELNQETGRGLLASVRDQVVEEGESVVLDLGETEQMDARGGAWLIEIADLVRSKNGTMRYEGQQGQVAAFVDLIRPALAAAPASEDKRPGFLERVGADTFSIVAEVREAGNLLIDSIYWTFIGPLEQRRFRWNLLLDEMHEMGVRALQITCLMNFLLGLIIAMLSAAQLRQFGVEIWVADLVMIAFARELAAVMTAVVVSARTGAAIAAELATMKVQEEIDALRGMGLSVPQFLVAPKIVALIVVLPCLTALGMVAGVLGGALWGTVVLDIGAKAWFNETLWAASVGDVCQGLFKSLVFAIVIVLVGCHNGLRVRGGSREVGLMTTRAVVMDIFFLIVVDMIFAAVFYYVL